MYPMTYEFLQAPDGMHLVWIHPSFMWQLPCPKPQVTAESCGHSPVHHTTPSPLYPATLQEAANVIKNCSHPSHPLSSPLALGRTYKILKACNTRFKDCFFPAVIRLLTQTCRAKHLFPNLPIYLPEGLALFKNLHIVCSCHTIFCILSTFIFTLPLH